MEPDISTLHKPDILILRRQNGPNTLSNQLMVIYDQDGHFLRHRDFPLHIYQCIVCFHRKV